MTNAEHDEDEAHRDRTLNGASAERPPAVDSVRSLRGAEAVSIGRGFWTVLAALGLAVFAVIVVVTILSAASDNARIGRMKAHGIAVTVTVVDCAGNIGGSGSNAAGYTCRGEYSVGGATYHELIASMTTFAAPGTTVSAIADPSKPSSVVLASAVKKSDASPSAYVAPGLLAVVLIALTLIYFRVARRSKPRRHAPAPASSLEP